MRNDIEIAKDRCLSQAGPGRERATRSEADTMVRRSARARLGQVERATRREADTLARRSARARLGQVERATRREADTMARRSARARLGQVERATRREADTLVRRSACARQSQQQATTLEWSHLQIHIQLPSTLDIGTTVPIAMPTGYAHSHFGIM